MSLKSWRDNDWLVEHQTSQQEISDLLKVADRDLTDCETPGLSPDWQLSIAYNAALQTATAALAACGYRASRDAHHYRIIQSLVHTIESDSNIINQFDQFRKKETLVVMKLQVEFLSRKQTRKSFENRLINGYDINIQG